MSKQLEGNVKEQENKTTTHTHTQTNEHNQCGITPILQYSKQIKKT